MSKEGEGEGGEGEAWGKEGEEKWEEKGRRGDGDWWRGGVMRLKFIIFT